MTTKEAITLFKYYLQSNHKTRTIKSYTLLLERFNAIHAEKLLEDVTPDEIFHFLRQATVITENVPSWEFPSLFSLRRRWRCSAMARLPLT